MNAFYRPRSLPAALDVLATEPVQVLAGGTDIYPADATAIAWGKAGLEHPHSPRLLDISAVDGLRKVEYGENAEGDQVVTIGAGVTWTRAINCDLPAWFDGLRAAAREVGGRQIQNRGTLAGNLCNASPAADGVPPLLALDARVRLQSQNGCRELPLDQFIVGNRQTRRRPDELLTAIVVPDPGRRLRSTFLKLGARRYLVISIAMVAVSVKATAGIIDDIRIAVGACSEVARRLPDLEARLMGGSLADAPERVAAEDFAALRPVDDVRASADYRRHAAQVLVSRALEELCADDEALT